MITRFYSLIPFFRRTHTKSRALMFLASCYVSSRVLSTRLVKFSLMYEQNEKEGEN